MSNGKSNGTGPRHSGSNGSAGSGSAHPNGQVGSLNCAEFFRNPYGMYEDESIETAIEASPGIMAEAVGEGNREPVILNVYGVVHQIVSPISNSESTNFVPNTYYV